MSKRPSTMQSCTFSGGSLDAQSRHVGDGIDTVFAGWGEKYVRVAPNEFRLEEEQGNPDSPRGLLLDEAKRLITGDRNNQYGEPGQDFQRTAKLWSSLGFRVNGDDVAAHHVAMAMICLKLSRLSWDPGKKDSWADVAGYAGCGWETTKGFPDA